jgi:BirA family biotin operon repressor/biotin-[acetyl-CoA-carboxylase] ligase
MPDAFLDADTIRDSTFVRYVEIHDTLGSTNDRAKELALDPAIQLPAIVVARHQSAGRGRGDNGWWSADGALTFSLLLDPAAYGIPIDNWPQLSLCTAVAVCDTTKVELVQQRGGISKDCENSREAPEEYADSTSDRIAIKWPNDVMLDDAKVCGILIESPAGSAEKNRLVVGVGLNVNNALDQAPTTLRAKITSVGTASGSHHSLLAVLVKLLRRIELRFRELASNAPQLCQEWQRLSWLSGRQVRVNLPPGSTDGICLGIGLNGAMLLRTVNAIESIYSGSIELL